MRSIDLPPFAPTLMESTRAIGYSIEAAIADIIDNSIAAGADKIEIDFFPLGDSYISILDNGHGMNEEEIISSMQYGSRNPLDQREESDLGRYGLGMKTASLSQCRILSVISKKLGKLSGCQWNLNHIIKAESWSLIILDENEINEMPNIEKLKSHQNGTLIVWQDLDKFSIGEVDISEAFTRKMKLIQDHIALVFHRYLTGETGIKKLDILMNGLSIQAKDPFLIKKSTLLMDEEAIIVRGQKVKVRPYILPHTSKLSSGEINDLGGKEGLRKQQGFYVYRNKRLLVWGTWFRLMRQGDLSKLARVQVDIPNSLDDLWTLDIKKSTATPPMEIKRNLGIVLEKIAEGSKRTWTYRGKKERSEKVVHLWNRMTTRDGGVYYDINMDHPLVKGPFDSYPQLNQQLKILLQQISRTLPLNSLFLDLTNDEKIENDTEVSQNEIIQLLKEIIQNYDQTSQRYQVMDSLKLTEPFCSYTEEIEKAKEMGVFDD